MSSEANDLVVKKINEHPLSREEMIKFLEEIELLPAEDRGFEAHAFVAVRVFNPDPDKASSVMFRMEALSRLIQTGEISGWTRNYELTTLSNFVNMGLWRFS